VFASCDSSTDVEWLDANLPFETRAQYVCANLSGSICLASEVTLDPAQINIGSNDPEDRKKSACHEAGHSVDLQHGDNKTDCRGAVRPSGVREDGSDRARGIFFVEDRTLEPYLDFIIDEGLGRPAAMPLAWPRASSSSRSRMSEKAWADAQLLEAVAS